LGDAPASSVADAPPLLLIHGGLAEKIGAEEFWERPGIAPGLRTAGFAVIAPDRDTTPASWTDAALDVSKHLARRAVVIAGSNGVSVAVRLVLELPALVDRLVLLWPATAGDPQIDQRTPDTARHLLAGDTLRGVTDDELPTLDTPTVVMASDPPNPFHSTLTVDRLVQLMPMATRIPTAFPESPRPEFSSRCHAFLDVLIQYLR
jgi:hypothetical protein